MTTNPDLTIPGTDERAIANRDVLAADTAMGPVTLLVGDLDALTNYYVEGLALTVLSAEGSRTVLGRGSTPIIVLQHDPTLPRGSRRDAGLFHTAILFEDPGALAAAVGSLARLAPRSFVGSSDHLVSEAFRSEEHTSELQSRGHLVCRLLLEKKNDEMTIRANETAS